MKRALEQLAQDLAAARAGGWTVSPPADDRSALSLEQAYEVQERVTALLGAESRGWKVGSTSVAAQQRLGTSEPGAGRLPRQYVFESGAHVGVSPAHDVQVEVEFAFRLGMDLAPRDAPYEAGEVRQAVAAFMPGIELVGSRLVSGLAGSGRALVTADGGANVAFIAGREVALTGPWDLVDHECSLRINGEQTVTGTGARALGDPVLVLTWLANHLAARGMTLASGEIVTTGTCTGLEHVTHGDVLVGDFGSLGAVEVHLKPVDE